MSEALEELKVQYYFLVDLYQKETGKAKECKSHTTKKLDEEINNLVKEKFERKQLNRKTIEI